MNKKTIRIAGWALGLSLVVGGIGAIAATSKAPIETKADNYSAYTGALTEGDYIIYYNGYAMKAAVSSNRLSYRSVTPSESVISNPDADIIWHIAPSGDYWTIYNSDASKYAGSSGTKNQAALLTSGSDDKSLWTISGTSTYEFVNKYNEGQSINANLRNNGTYGFACYSTSTGGALSLYKIDASDSPISSISLLNDGARTSYVDGDTISTSNIKAIATHEDATTSDVTSDCTITVSPATATLGLTSVTYSATYDGEGEFSISNLPVTINVEALAISSIQDSEEHPVKKNFTENDVFSLGDGKIQLNWNNGDKSEIDLDEDGVTYSIDSVDYTGKDYYLTTSDAGKTVTINYSGKSFEYDIGTVSSAAVEVFGTYYQLVTNVSQLSGSDKVVITSGTSGSKVALSTTQNTNNRGQTAVTISANKISEISESVQEITLEASSTNFKLCVGDDAYLYAASSSNNYLKTASSETAGDNGVFEISVNTTNSKATLMAAGSNSRKYLRYNSSNSLFSCYETAGSQSDIYLFKLVDNPKPANRVAVENFIDDYLHFDDVSYNDHSDTNACRAEGTGAQSWYATAKAKYNDDEVLTDAQRELFVTSDVFIIKRGYERLSAWADANGDKFDDTDHTLVEKARNVIAPSEIKVSNALPIVGAVSSATLLGTAGAFFLVRKRREN